MKNNNSTLSVRDQQRLFGMNLIAAVLHFLSGAGMLWLSNNFTLPVTSSFLRFNTVTQTLNPVLETVVNLRVGPVVAAFLFLSSIAHLAIVLSHIFDWYIKNLARHINMARWVEYSFSSSLMIVVIAMLTGIYDIVSLILLVGVNASMILFGWMMELHNQSTEKTNWTAFIFGCIAGIFPWIAIAIYLGGAGSGDGQVPTFVYYIFGSIFVFFNIFALNQYLQYKKIGPWKNYLFGEYTYIVLSLVAKSLLAWQVFAGTLRPM